MNYKRSPEKEPELVDSLTPGSSQQMAPPVIPPIAPVNQPIIQPTPKIVPRGTLPGMPPSVTPDEISGYIRQNKMNMSKFGPQQQVDLQNALSNQRNSLGYKITDAGKGFADALMQGVARAGNPGWQQQFENQSNLEGQQQLDTLQKAHSQQAEDVKAGMSLDMSDPNSNISKTYRDSYAPIFAKMGYSPDSLKRMSASQIGTVAELGVKYADVQVQNELKMMGLRLQEMAGLASIQNQKSQRQGEALKQLVGMPWYSRLMHPDISGALEQEAGLNEDKGPMKFSTEEEAKAANLPDGTRVIINGVSGTWKH